MRLGAGGAGLRSASHAKLGIGDWDPASRFVQFWVECYNS